MRNVEFMDETFACFDLEQVTTQIATSVGQGCAAAMQCEKWLAERE